MERGGAFLREVRAAGRRTRHSNQSHILTTGTTRGSWAPATTSPDTRRPRSRASGSQRPYRAGSTTRSRSPPRADFSPGGRTSTASLAWTPQARPPRARSASSRRTGSGRPAFALWTCGPGASTPWRSRTTAGCTPSAATTTGSSGSATSSRAGPPRPCRWRAWPSPPSRPASGIRWLGSRPCPARDAKKALRPLRAGRRREWADLGLWQQQRVSSLRPNALCAERDLRPARSPLRSGQLGTGNFRSSSVAVPVNITARTWCDTLDETLISESFRGGQSGSDPRRRLEAGPSGTSGEFRPVTPRPQPSCASTGGGGARGPSSAPAGTTTPSPPWTTGTCTRGASRGRAAAPRAIRRPP